MRVLHDRHFSDDAVPVPGLDLSDRQALVLRALIGAYVAEGAPVGSKTISHLLPVALSSASIRATMGDLMAQGLLERPHKSSGRVPTATGLRLFLEQLFEPRELPASERNRLARSFDDVEVDGVFHRASALLSSHARQLGFVAPPRLDALILRHISLVRLSTERVLAVMITESGQMQRRILRDEVSDQRELERMAAALNRVIAGASLGSVRDRLERELERLRKQADDLVERAIALGLDAFGSSEAHANEPDASELVIATRLALLDQPEFHDAARIRELFEAIEGGEALAELVERVLVAPGVAIALGGELADPGLRHCALVLSPYGGAGGQGVLGVIGPSRMDYGYVTGLVDTCAQLLTEKLGDPL